MLTTLNRAERCQLMDAPPQYVRRRRDWETLCDVERSVIEWGEHPGCESGFYVWVDSEELLITYVHKSICACISLAGEQWGKNRNGFA